MHSLKGSKTITNGNMAIRNLAHLKEISYIKYRMYKTQIDTSIMALSYDQFSMIIKLTHKG